MTSSLSESERTEETRGSSATGTVSAPDFYRHMLGWNRKAIRITLPTVAHEAQVHAVEMLCSTSVMQPKT